MCTLPVPFSIYISTSIMENRGRIRDGVCGLFGQLLEVGGILQGIGLAVGRMLEG
jgi:hypothetical protein